MAIDYSLLVVVRWREERAPGARETRRCVRAMQTAGRAVVFSGTTVAIGLLALIVLPLPFLRSIGFAGMLIPLISVIVAITLLPIVLATRRPAARLAARAQRARARVAPWTRWARLVVRGRWLAAGGAVVVLLALVFAATSLTARLGQRRHARAGRGRRARPGRAERSGIGAGALQPIEVFSAPARRPGTSPTALRAVPGIHGAVAPTRRAVEARRHRASSTPSRSPTRRPPRGRHR